MKAFCLFEQSGTFKNELIKLGIPAEDFDIQNEFGETDHVLDLYKEIRGGYDGKPSIFDRLEPDDLVLAFFPCTRFEAQISMAFRGETAQMKKWTDKQKLEYCMKLHDELHENYELISKLACIALDRGFRMVIENPANRPHYLNSYWCIKPSMVDRDRRENGDYSVKPTQFWFFNCKPKQTLLFEPIEEVEYRVNAISKPPEGMSRATMRSMIHPQYARRFIKQYIL